MKQRKKTPLTTKSREGFTLLEILIVVLIVGFLAMLAVMNFGSIRKSAQLSFTIDAAENLFNSTRDNARFGKGLIDGKSVCWGLSIDTTKPREEQIKQFTTKYLRGDSSCDLSKEPDQFNRTDLLKEEKIKLHKIAADKDQNPEQLILLFKPPKAEIAIYDKFGVGASAQTKIKSLNFSFGFETDTEETQWETLQFNVFSGEVKKLNPNETNNQN